MASSLRLSAGVGGARTEVSDLLDKIEIDGAVGEVNSAIGGCIVSNLPLHATLFGWEMTPASGSTART